MQDELDRLAGLLGRSVTVDGPTGRLLGYSVQSDDADGARISTILARQVPEPVRRWQDAHGIATATAPVRIPANADLPMSARLCVPLRDRGVLRAYLWVVEGEPALTEAQVGVAVAAGDRVLALLPGPVDGDLAPLLAALAAPAPPDEAERLVGAMVDVAPDLAGSLVRLTVGRPLPGSGARRRWRATGALVAVADVGDRLVLLSRSTTSGAALRAARDLLPTEAYAVGVGPGARLGAAALLGDLARADLTAECAAADPRLPDALAWERLGLYQRFLDREPPARPDVLAPLLDAPGESTDMLLATLETYLDLAGDAQRTASALALHRTTLYYRLNRAAGLLGGDLRDGLWRTDLHQALKGRRLRAAREARE